MSLTPRQLDILRYVAGYQKRRGISPTFQEIADHLGISKVTVFEHVRALARRKVLRTEKFLSRSIEILDTELLDQIAAAETTASGQELPLLGCIAAGRPLESFQTGETIDVRAAVGGGKDCFVLQVRGDSMIEDHIQDGDYVVVEKRETARNGETVVALLDNGETTLKRLYRDGDRIRLQPANGSMAPIYVDSVRIQGVVAGVLRRY